MQYLNPDYLKQEHSNPFNWTGSKHRYLTELFEVLPDDKHLTVIDPFVGGGDLISKLPKTWSIFASDAMPQLIDMHKQMQLGMITTDRIKEVVKWRKLDKVNDDAFTMLKSYYNHHKALPAYLYTLLCHSNSNRIRFNSACEFNVAFGDRTFNTNMQKKLDNHLAALGDLTVNFNRSRYTDVNFKKADLLLIDPPYLNTVATYTEGGKWTVNDEFELLNKVYQAHLCNTKFIYFGQTWSNGVHNPHLEAWAKQFNVKVLKDTTSHCSSNRKKGKTVEIMITNY